MKDIHKLVVKNTKLCEECVGKELLLHTMKVITGIHKLTACQGIYLQNHNVTNSIAERRNLIYILLRAPSDLYEFQQSLSKFLNSVQMTKKFKKLCKRSSHFKMLRFFEQEIIKNPNIETIRNQLGSHDGDISIYTEGWNKNNYEPFILAWSSNGNIGETMYLTQDIVLKGANITSNDLTKSLDLALSQTDKYQEDLFGLLFEMFKLSGFEIKSENIEWIKDSI